MLTARHYEPNSEWHIPMIAVALSSSSEDPVPALVTVLLPPIVFRLTGRRVLAYLLLAALSAPLIHVLFSLILGWGEYMPFWPIPR